MAVTFLSTSTYSAMTRPLCTCIPSLCLCLTSPHVYKRSMLRLRNSKRVLFCTNTSRRTTLPIPLLVNHDPRANTLYRILLSPERLPRNFDLAIRVTTTRNIRTRFRTIEQTGSRPNHPRRLRNRKGIPHRNIPPITTTTNASPAILPHYVLHRTKYRTRTSRSSVGLSQSSVDTFERSS